MKVKLANISHSKAAEKVNASDLAAQMLPVASKLQALQTQS
jgi:hypothetical protein